jgi:hypothetical protein
MIRFIALEAQSYRWSKHFQFTADHTLGFSVFTSRILATDYITVPLSLQIVHEDFFAQPNSFLAFILQPPVPKTRLNSIPLLQSSASWRLETRLNSVLLLPASERFFITILYGSRRKHSLSIVGKACLQRRCVTMEVYSIVGCVIVTVGMCLPSRCLAMNFYSDFTIPAFRRHVTRQFVYVK